MIKSIPVGDGPWNVAYNPANKKIYVINNLASTVSIIGSYSNKVLDTVKVGKGPWDIIYNPANKYMYVANPESGTISVINPLDIISKPDPDDALKPTFKKNLH